jgi:D-alanyl-D-alanine carboxypeptidase/D-alanyl-D-alanine-endopeptidase (penicillin-binding protein 4)
MPQRLGVIVSAAALAISSAAAIGGWFITPALAPHVVETTATWKAGAKPVVPPPVLDAGGTGAPTPTNQGLTAALGPLVRLPGLGTHTGVAVVDVASGQQVYGLSPDAAMTPASVTKLITGTTVLATRGPQYRIATRAVAGPNPGEVVLVGGGDPTLAVGEAGTYPGAGRLDDLAAQVRKALGATAPTKVIYDGSLFSGELTGPGWDPDSATGGYGSVITALMTDGARVDPRRAKGGATRYAQPDVAAAQAFARLLDLPPAAIVPGVAVKGAKELGKVESAPLMRIVETMLAESDNVVAEMLARQVAITQGQPVSFGGEAAAMRSVLGGLGVPVDGFGLFDGSGLSRTGKLSPVLLAHVLATAARADKPDLHAIFAGLPVAGYSGTLAGRFRTSQGGSAAAGEVRAKTGTLTGVNSLAGIVVDADGRVLAFAAIADQNRGGAVEILDRIAATLAACGCH